MVGTWVLWEGKRGRTLVEYDVLEGMFRVLGGLDYRYWEGSVGRSFFFIVLFR